jgi:hypothetical protein
MGGSHHTERIPEEIINGNSTNTKATGKSRTRWEDIIQDTLQVLGVQGSRRQAGDREEWRHLFEEGQGPEGAAVPCMDGWIESACTAGVKTIINVEVVLYCGNCHYLCKQFIRCKEQ